MNLNLLCCNFQGLLEEIQFVTSAKDPQPVLQVEDFIEVTIPPNYESQSNYEEPLNLTNTSFNPSINSTIMEIPAN